MPSKHPTSSRDLASACVPASDDITLQISSGPKKQHTTRSFFWCISLYGVPTNAAQLCNVRQTNTCVLLAKNPSSHVLSHACISRTSSLLCLFQWNLPSGGCLSLSPVFTLTKCSFMCLPQQNTTQPTFQRTLKFPLPWPEYSVPPFCWSWSNSECLLLFSGPWFGSEHLYQAAHYLL